MDMKRFVVLLCSLVLVFGLVGFVFADTLPVATPPASTPATSASGGLENMVSCCDCTTFKLSTKADLTKCTGSIDCNRQCFSFGRNDIKDFTKVDYSKLLPEDYDKLLNDPTNLERYGKQVLSVDNLKVSSEVKNGVKFSADKILNGQKELPKDLPGLQNSQVTITKDGFQIVPKEGAKFDSAALQKSGKVELLGDKAFSLDGIGKSPLNFEAGSNVNVVDGVVKVQPDSSFTHVQPDGVVTRVDVYGKELNVYTNKLGSSGENYISFMDSEKSAIKVQTVDGAGVGLQTGTTADDFHLIKNGNSALYGDNSFQLEPNGKTYGLGARDPIVAQAQGLMGTKDIDGVLGFKTMKDIRAFQKANGLPITGKLDPATQQALFSRLDGTSYVGISQSKLEMFVGSDGKPVLMPNSGTLSKTAALAGGSSILSQIGKAPDLIKSLSGMLDKGGAGQSSVGSSSTDSQTTITAGPEGDSVSVTNLQASDANDADTKLSSVSNVLENPNLFNSVAKDVGLTGDQVKAVQGIIAAESSGRPGLITYGATGGLDVGVAQLSGNPEYLKSLPADTPVQYFGNGGGTTTLGEILSDPAKYELAMEHYVNFKNKYNDGSDYNALDVKDSLNVLKGMANTIQTRLPGISYTEALLRAAALNQRGIQVAIADNPTGRSYREAIKYAKEHGVTI